MPPRPSRDVISKGPTLDNGGTAIIAADYKTKSFYLGGPDLTAESSAFWRDSSVNPELPEKTTSDMSHKTYGRVAHLSSRSLVHPSHKPRRVGHPLYLLAPLLQRRRQMHAGAGVGGDVTGPVTIPRHAHANRVLSRLQLQRGRAV